jgi:hypothetical protein
MDQAQFEVLGVVLAALFVIDAAFAAGFIGYAWRHKDVTERGKH